MEHRSLRTFSTAVSAYMTNLLREQIKNQAVQRQTQLGGKLKTGLRDCYTCISQGAVNRASAL